MSSKEHSNHDNKVDSRQQFSQPTVQDRAAITGYTAPAAIVRRARFNPESLTPDDVLQLQGAIGNQAVQRLLRRAKPDGQKARPGTEEITPFADDFSRTPAHASSRPGIQAKLTVSSPGDSYEQEADRVSEQVMGGPETRLQRACECGGGECAACRKGHAAAHDQWQIKRSQANDSGGMAAQDIVHEVLSSPGRSLDSSTRGLMESRFGHNFGGVRVHADARAARSADTVQAHAYTVGEDMVFGAGRYAPASNEGKSLIAHELAHVVQQRRAPVDAGVVEPAGSPAEREAEAAASATARGGAPVALTATPRGLSRDVGWAQRGPIPDPYGMGYNTIFSRAGANSVPTVHALASLETLSMGVDLTQFAALPTNTQLAIVALQPHASGTACESWFPQMLGQLQQAGPLTYRDPYGTSTTVTAHLFEGRSARRALIIGGVHNRTEPQGAAVVDRLRNLLTSRAALGNRPFFTVILVPDLFARSRYSPGDPRWIQGGMGRDTSGALSTNRPVEPNRNFPLPGEDLSAAQARGSSGSNAPELVFTDPANPTAGPRPAHDTSIAGGGGTSIRMLPETRTLISLIEHFRPERIASIHAHSLKRLPGDAPGIFVDPRGVNPTTGAVTNAAQAAEDDRLAAAMVRTGRSRLASTPIRGATSDPFVGNVPPTGSSTVRYASGVHAEGNSLGTWAPAPVASGPGARAGITTLTVEVPQWTGSGQATQLGQIEDLDRDLLADIFLEDPATVTPATAPTTP